MKNQLQKAVQLYTIVCLSGILATGCSASPTSGSTDNPVADLTSSSDAPVNAEPSQTAQAQDSADMDKPDENPDASTTQTDTASNGTEGKWHVYPPDVAAAVDADFEGTVWKMDTNSFYIAPAETEILEDGTLLGSLAPDAEIPDSDLVQVVFDENTHFYIRTIYDGGERYEDSDAAFSDIEKDQIISLKGSFENDIFHATEIRISKVV